MDFNGTLLKMRLWKHQPLIMDRCIYEHIWKYFPNFPHGGLDYFPYSIISQWKYYFLRILILLIITWKRVLVMWSILQNSNFYWSWILTRTWLELFEFRLLTDTTQTVRILLRKLTLFKLLVIWKRKMWLCSFRSITNFFGSLPRYL